MLDPEAVRMGYLLILDRSPSDSEVEAGRAGFANLQGLRQAFLRSREFRRKFDRIATAAEEAQTPALVHLEIPGTGAAALRDRLLTLDALHPARAAEDAGREELRRLPATEQRALRYLHGDLSYGVGEALEGPHHYLAMIAAPGPRLHALWKVLDARQGGGKGFGHFLETALDDSVLRPEVDNGQIRRLAGDMDIDSVGQEPALLRRALHNALGPRIFLGFDEAPQALISVLAENGLFEGTAPPQLAQAAAHPDYDRDLAALSPAQKQIFDACTAWDGYLHEVCRQLLLPAFPPSPSR